MKNEKKVVRLIFSGYLCIMLSYLFTSAIILSVIAWVFDWDGNRKAGKEFKNNDCYKDPDFFFDNAKYPTNDTDS